MIVKIGNKFTDSKDEPIMIILSNEEKVLIASMGEQTKFCSYALNEIDSADKMREFMKDEEEVKEGYFQNGVSWLEYEFTKILAMNSPLYPEEAKELVEFFKSKNKLSIAKAIFEERGYSDLLAYKMIISKA